MNILEATQGFDGRLNRQPFWLVEKSNIGQRFE